MPGVTWVVGGTTDDFKPWWRHQMETFSALLAICAGNSPVPVTSPHKGQWRGILMFSLICTRINCWVNNREAGDLRRHLAHYDVIVMNIQHQMPGVTWVVGGTTADFKHHTALNIDQQLHPRKKVGYNYSSMGLLPDTQNCGSRTRREYRNVFPAADFKGNR